MQALDLASRMQNLKKVHDTQVTSEDKTPTPLWVLLYIYTYATNECYPQYYEGARELIKYLSPIYIPPISHSKIKLPRAVVGYEITELATILASSPAIENSVTNSVTESITNHLKEVRHIERAIVHTSLHMSDIIDSYRRLK